MVLVVALRAFAKVNAMMDATCFVPLRRLFSCFRPMVMRFCGVLMIRLWMDHWCFLQRYSDCLYQSELNSTTVL